MTTFEVVYLTVVDAERFGPVEHVALPFVLHCAITDGALSHFDGLCIRDRHDLDHSPEVIWLTAAASDG